MGMLSENELWRQGNVVGGKGGMGLEKMWRLKVGGWYANIKQFNKAAMNLGANVKHNSMPTAPTEEPNSLPLKTGIYDFNFLPRKFLYFSLSLTYH